MSNHRLRHNQKITRPDGRTLTADTKDPQFVYLSYKGVYVLRQTKKPYGKVFAQGSMMMGNPDYTGRDAYHLDIWYPDSAGWGIYNDQASAGDISRKCDDSYSVKWLLDDIDAGRVTP